MENIHFSKRDDCGVGSKHKVFLCHSGVQKDFVEQLCDEIERYSRSVFFDKRRESLQIGCDFPQEILKAIEECEVGVVVVSKAFFTKSMWPMQEFARLAKRKEENKKFVLILVLFDIELAECRNIDNHAEWKRLWESWGCWNKHIVIEDWMCVFKLFGPILSISYDKKGGAKQLIREVVEAICEHVMPDIRGDDLDMQGRQRFCELICEKMCESQVSRGYGTRVVGLYGMGGIGKSTVCKALCNELQSEFGGKVCHAELATKSDDRKEEELLREVARRLIGTAREVVLGYDKTECLNLLKNNLWKQKVFLAIDNVGDSASTIMQAKALLRAGYAKDSCLIVTARTVGMLQNLGINEKDCHEMPELEYEEAKCLFLNNAPKDPCLGDGFIKQCVERCRFSKGVGKRDHYHPLALKVLGGQLGYDPEEWMARLRRRDPFNALEEREHQIFSIFRDSFDTLKAKDQLLFMDVALFFLERKCCSRHSGVGLNIITWLCIVHGSNEEDLMFRLKALKRKSLIECIGDGNDVVGVHDLWREFCVTEAKTDDFKNQCWFYRVDDIHDSVEECSFYSGGWERLQRVCLSVSSVATKKIIEVKRVNLQYCSTLTVLKLVEVDVKNGLVDLSPLLQLKSLEVWSLKTPIELQGLGVLWELCVLVWGGISSNSTCVEEIAGLINLQVLALSPCKDESINFPDLNGLSSLRLVRFKRMGSTECRLVGLGSSMMNLQYLDLRRSRGMRSCYGVDDLVALLELDLSDCTGLETLPYLGKLKNLRKLDISGCIVSAVSGLECLGALREFTATNCKYLKMLPDMRMLSNLQTLDLRDSFVEPFPGLEKLTALQQLRVHFDTVKYYPALPQLAQMQGVLIEAWRKRGLPCMVGWTGLESLTLVDCKGVRKLEGLESLSSLQSLSLWRCDFWDMSRVSCLTSLESLIIWGCKELEMVPNLDRLLRLETLRLDELHSIVGEVCRTLPELCSLELWNLPIHDLPNLSNFPQLRELDLFGCHSITRVNSNVPLTTLERVSIQFCRRLESLPDFNGFTKLRDLVIEGCRSLKSVPNFSD